MEAELQISIKHYSRFSSQYKKNYSYNILKGHLRQVTRKKPKSGATVIHQRKALVVFKTLNVEGLFMKFLLNVGLFKSSAAPLYCYTISDRCTIIMHYKLLIFIPSTLLNMCCTESSHWL